MNYWLLKYFFKVAVFAKVVENMEILYFPIFHLVRAFKQLILNLLR